MPTSIPCCSIDFSGYFQRQAVRVCVPRCLEALLEVAAVFLSQALGSFVKAGEIPVLLVLKALKE